MAPFSLLLPHTGLNDPDEIARQRQQAMTTVDAITVTAPGKAEGAAFD